MYKPSSHIVGALRTLDEAAALGKCVLCDRDAVAIARGGRPSCCACFLAPLHTCVCGVCGAEHQATYRSWICAECRSDGERRDVGEVSARQRSKALAELEVERHIEERGTADVVALVLS